MNYGNHLLSKTWFFIIFFVLSVPLVGIIKTAKALTPEEVIKLKEADVSDEVIMEMIKKDKSKENGTKRSDTKASRINLRSSYIELSVSQGQSMSNIFIRKKVKRGFSGHSTVKHNYESKSINGDNVVIDHTTGLMWHQSGSLRYIPWKYAKECLDGMWVNAEGGYAGYRDWRLPTVEEAASLLEPSVGIHSGYIKLYINPVFSDIQTYIWTGDKEAGSKRAWIVSYECREVRCHGSASYVRPVRTMK